MKTLVNQPLQQGKLLVDVQAAVNLIRFTTTENGLTVACMFDKNVYETVRVRGLDS